MSVKNQNSTELTFKYIESMATPPSTDSIKMHMLNKHSVGRNDTSKILNTLLRKNRIQKLSDHNQPGINFWRAPVANTDLDIPETTQATTQSELKQDSAVEKPLFGLASVAVEDSLDNEIKQQQLCENKELPKGTSAKNFIKAVEKIWETQELEGLQTQIFKTDSNNEKEIETIEVTAEFALDHAIGLIKQVFEAVSTPRPIERRDIKIDTLKRLAGLMSDDIKVVLQDIAADLLDIDG